MIKLSNGHAFEYMAASGALGFYGQGWWWERPLKWRQYFLDPALFTAVSKTLTLGPVKGNFRWYWPFRVLRFIDGGVVNAFGLGNPGIHQFCRNFERRRKDGKVPLVVSILGQPAELAVIAKILDDFDLVGLEINTSCPNFAACALNDSARIINSVEVVKANSRFPIILKISIEDDLDKIVPEVEGLVEAFAINSVPWSSIYPDCLSPLDQFGGGGVSGKAAQSFTWSLVRKISEMTTIPVIGPSIWEYNDLAKLRLLGAKAISFGAIFLRYPWRPTAFVRRDKKEYLNK